MLQSYLSHVALICLSSTLAVLSFGCSVEQPTVTTTNQPSPSENIEETEPEVQPEIPQAVPKPPENEPNALERALDKAAGATAISKSAQSPEDWNLVASQLSEAIALMRKVRRNSPNFAYAQSQIGVYQQQIKAAQIRAQAAQEPIASSFPDNPDTIIIPVPRPANTPQQPPPLSLAKESSPKPVTSTKNTNPDTVVFTVPIKRRAAGTPVIEVTFNNQQKFEMIVDTGASGTLITQKMAEALGVKPIGKAKANTASSKNVLFPLGYVNSIEVGGLETNNIPVAIAGSDLEIGLLGHDFFGKYDVTIKRDIIEFRPQSS